MASFYNPVKILVCTGGSWNTDNEITTYEPVGLPRRTLHLPTVLKLTELKSMVAKKLNLSESDFRMTYLFPPSSSDQKKNGTHVEVVEIADDEDVEAFIDATDEMTHGSITLYLVESDDSYWDW